MKNIQKFGFLVTLIAALHVSAQTTPSTKVADENDTITNFQLPTFSELSNDIASNYTKVLELLPDLSTIGKYVKKDFGTGMFDQNNISYTFRNFVDENSILPNITPKRFQLRNNLNRIMFNGFDVNQLHLNEAYKQ